MIDPRTVVEQLDAAQTDDEFIDVIKNLFLSILEEA